MKLKTWEQFKFMFTLGGTQKREAHICKCAEQDPDHNVDTNQPPMSFDDWEDLLAIFWLYNWKK